LKPITFFDKYKIQPREQQTQILNAVLSAWDQYRYFALSAPTGVGKTYIATALADTVGTTYILTSTLQLQDQYMGSWDKLINLKGRGNYVCNMNPDFMVDAAPCAAQSDLLKLCIKGNICAYYNQKAAALRSQAMITNPVYMLYSTHCGFAEDAESPWVKRDVLIIDEAHNLENHLVQFAESDIDPEKLQESFGIHASDFVFTGRLVDDYQLVTELYEVLGQKAIELAAKIASEFPTQKLLFDDEIRAWARGVTKKAAEKVQKLNAKAYLLDKAIQPLKIFFNTHHSFEELESRWIISKVSDKNILKLAPIYGDFLFQEYFGKLADKFVFLSATIGSKTSFSKELGVKEDELFFIETDSPFDPKLSPIISIPLIQLSKQHYAKNIERVGKLIDDILEVHAQERGIIHGSTYQLCTDVTNRVNATNRARLLSRDMDIHLSKGGFPKRYKNSELLELHERGPHGRTNSVLLSPSMMEGIDLHDDLSKFQVIIKLPWPNLGDLRVKIKSDLDSDWYNNRMWLSVLQASGRSTRHETDESITYILDSKFKYFYELWQRRLPDWFKERLVF